MGFVRIRIGGGELVQTPDKTDLCAASVEAHKLSSEKVLRLEFVSPGGPGGPVHETSD